MLRREENKKRDLTAIVVMVSPLAVYASERPRANGLCPDDRSGYWLLPNHLYANRPYNDCQTDFAMIIRTDM